jgi:glycosyltransferase involved in cell wall biosynthesis
MRSLEINIPVYNEEVDLSKNIPILYTFCTQYLNCYAWKIVIIDNASKDATWQKVTELKCQYPGKVDGLHLDRKGRGFALRTAWKKSLADYVSYMDVDLASDINSFPQMIKMLDEGYDLVTGSRNCRDSRVIGRTLLREIMSKTYIFLVKLIHGTKLSDTQCGFKALRREAFLKIEPLIVNNLWFFDSEMVIVMERSGFKVGDIPIKWTDDRHTTVKVAKDSWEEFSGLVRLYKTKPWSGSLNKKAPEL